MKSHETPPTGKLVGVAIHAFASSIFRVMHGVFDWLLLRCMRRPTVLGSPKSLTVVLLLDMGLVISA